MREHYSPSAPLLAKSMRPAAFHARNHISLMTRMEKRSKLALRDKKKALRSIATMFTIHSAPSLFSFVRFVQKKSSKSNLEEIRSAFQLIPFQCVRNLLNIHFIRNEIPGGKNGVETKTLENRKERLLNSGLK